MNYGTGTEVKISGIVMFVLHLTCTRYGTGTVCLGGAPEGKICMKLNAFSGYWQLFLKSKVPEPRGSNNKIM
jgi:hypothetical protein